MKLKMCGWSNEGQWELERTLGLPKLLVLPKKIVQFVRFHETAVRNTSHGMKLNSCNAYYMI